MCVRKVPSARAGVIFVCNILATIFYEPIVPTPSSMTIRDPKGTHWASYMTVRYRYWCRPHATISKSGAGAGRT